MRIFISHSHHDLETASRLSSKLRELDFEVIRADTFLEPGDDIAKRIREELLNSDSLIILWSQGSKESHSVMVELGYFIGLASDRQIIPIILDDSPIPPDLADYLCIRAVNKPIEDVALSVATSLSKIEGRRQKKTIEAKERKEEVEQSAATYIAESIQSLEIRESRYKNWSIGCYLLGYLTLLIGLLYSGFRIYQDPPDFSSPSQAVYLSLLTITAIGFLAAVSRFAFILGKSFMVESLRNHDRIHAIRFGEFYLKAFGDKVSWTELKEAFQHWNLDTGSTFKDQTTESIDPKVLSLLGDLLKSIKK